MVKEVEGMEEGIGGLGALKKFRLCLASHMEDALVKSIHMHSHSVYGIASRGLLHVPTLSMSMIHTETQPCKTLRYMCAHA